MYDDLEPDEVDKNAMGQTGMLFDKLSQKIDPIRKTYAAKYDCQVGAEPHDESGKIHILYGQCEAFLVAPMAAILNSNLSAHR